MLPRVITCEYCGEPEAIVKSYGRVDHDMNEVGHVSDHPELRLIELTIDCPKCGIRIQPYEHVSCEQD
jgi:hypothetical protein